MKVVEMNVGKKIEYEVTGTKLMFKDELMLNLERMERDFDVHIDVCKDKFGMLTMGLSENYVAQIDIPARRYDSQSNGYDAESNEIIVQVPVAFNMDNVTLTLWNMEG